MLAAADANAPPPTIPVGPVAESVEYALSMARPLAARLRGLDLHSCEPLGAEEAMRVLSRSTGQEAYRGITETIRLISSMPILVLGEAAPDPLATPEEDDPWLDGDEDATEGMPAPLQDRVAEEIEEALARLSSTRAEDQPIDPHLAVSIWRMLATQLRQCRERLAAARRTRCKWALITESEEGRRKALKSLQYGLTLAMRIAGWPTGALAFPEDPSELQVALRVREALIMLRRDLLGTTRDLEHLQGFELTMSLRDVRIRVLELFLAPVYRDLRAVDRYVLQTLRARLDVLLAGTDTDEEAAHCLLSDVRAFSGMLDQVNNRELLVTRDRCARTEALDALRDLAAMVTVAKRDGWWRYLRILREAAALRFRSEPFDHFVEIELTMLAKSGEALADAMEAARRVIADIRV